MRLAYLGVFGAADLEECHCRVLLEVDHLPARESPAQPRVLLLLELALALLHLEPFEHLLRAVLGHHLHVVALLLHRAQPRDVRAQRLKPRRLHRLLRIGRRGHHRVGKLEGEALR